MKILFELKGCPRIVRYLGNDLTIENELIIYNLFLEYIPGRTLADVIKATPHGLPESNVRSYTKSILLGLNYIHERGYVHCDIKPQNLLVCSSSEIKIADFGLSKKAGVSVYGDNHVRGTPLYVSPESVGWSEYDLPVDIWALGCVVVEMAVRKTAWECLINVNTSNLLFQIGFTKRLPEIPECLSEEGKDFLSRCFIKDPKKRWTAKMLLNHAFIVNDFVRNQMLSAHTSLMPPTEKDLKNYCPPCLWLQMLSSPLEGAGSERFPLFSCPDLRVAEATPACGSVNAVRQIDYLINHSLLDYQVVQLDAWNYDSLIGNVIACETDCLLGLHMHFILENESQRNILNPNIFS
ncbi:mitogen-activated protein kinase kinase kinase 20-like [Magnolia sinica]|uniref:mitogen-activated protein kinase kinase kinase 20-like n=1 Tax=Magnolia sinica TaxID=86752 RepID=UPI002657C823|nr:mitogen-activated protein kinase kinase kinase 20-like [Magnolia sinica]